MFTTCFLSVIWVWQFQYTSSLHIPARGLYVGRYPPQPASILWPSPTLSPTLLMAHATFEPKLFPCHFSFLVHSTHIYLPVKMEQCSETSKLQTPGNYPKESIQHPHFLLFILDASSVLFLLCPGFPSCLSLVGVATKNVHLFQISPSHATCATNFIILLSTRMVIKNVLVMSSACLGRLYIWGDLLKARCRRSLLGLHYVFTGKWEKLIGITPWHWQSHVKLLF